MSERTVIMTKAVSVVAKILPLVLASTAFLTPSPICRSIVPGRHRSLPLSPLFLFRRNNNKEQENVGVTDNPAEENKAEKEKSSFFNFFNRDQVEKQQQQHDGDDSTEKQQPAYTTAIADESPKTAMEEATWFRSEAEKARLEAERMDAELTLRKIERLEKELAAAAAFSNGTSDTKKRSGKSAADLQRQMDALLTKVRVGNNEKQSRSTFSSDNTATTTIATSNTPMTTLDTQSPTAATQVASPPSRTLLWPQHIAPYDENEYQELLDTVKAMPTFMQGSMAMQVELELDTDQETGQTSVNVTELAIRMDKMRRCDFSYSSKPPPTFTPLQISKLEAELVSADSATSETGKKYAGNWWGGGSFLFDTDNASMVSKLAKRIKTDERLNGLWEKDLNALAKLVLEYEYYLTLEDNPDEKEMDQIVKLMSQDNWLKPLLGLENGTFPSAVDEVIDSLYPKCTTKKNSEETNIPTEAQVMQFYTDILSKANFKATSKPEPVRGGYIVRGSTTLDGDMLISKLDAAMERSNLKDKMTILYTNDISMFADESMLDSPGFDPENIPPILYIVSPNICRDAMPVQLSIVTGLGIATSWYLSIIPFMLNPAIAARVDEQMAIAEANMIPDLAWLTDLSVPLFGTFLGIQLIHELGHLVVAGRNGITTSVPTFVPSIITGITSSVTTFRSPPKNKAAMFDFALAGPLAGMAASVLAIAVGSQLTTITDPSLFPALPLEILRQSTLGGGIIELILGNGALYVADGAVGTAAVAGMAVPLHPIACAGYISLIVNALAVLPVGTTDGGRAAIAVFGRATKVLIASFSFFYILFNGLLGSDIFLFYFAFCIAFQAGNEIPARNEVDKIGLPRIFLAAATYVIAALALVPFQ